MPLRWWCAVFSAWNRIRRETNSSSSILSISSCRRWIIVFENSGFCWFHGSSSISATLRLHLAPRELSTPVEIKLSQTFQGQGEEEKNFHLHCCCCWVEKSEGRIANHPHKVISSAIHHEQLEWAHQRCQCIGGRVLPGRHQDDQSEAC